MLTLGHSSLSYFGISSKTVTQGQGLSSVSKMTYKVVSLFEYLRQKDRYA